MATAVRLCKNVEHLHSKIFQKKVWKNLPSYKPARMGVLFTVCDGKWRSKNRDGGGWVNEAGDVNED